MDYKITRSDRKTMALYVHKDGGIEVKCPKKIPTNLIENFILQKRSWIQKKVQLVKEQTKQKEEFILNHSEQFRFLGSFYPVKKIDENKIGFYENSFILPKYLTIDEIKPAMIQIYKKLAKTILTKRVEHFSKIMKVNPTCVKINSAKTRWGSCSGKGSLNFSYKLLMAEEKTVDYVVIHELAHLEELNHSERFWKVVQNFMPDYKEQKLKLKELQKRITVEGWED